MRRADRREAKANDDWIIQEADKIQLARLNDERKRDGLGPVTLEQALDQRMRDHIENAKGKQRVRVQDGR
jgi:hypothetical protein